MSKRLKITLVRSFIGRPEPQRQTARALGLTKIRSSVIKDDTPCVRGMVRKVEHLLLVEEIEA
ncbi:MAG: 50S ribosomal protein L30 [Bacillota bacterium]